MSIVGCHNMMLSADGTVKLGDFAGSSLDGSRPTVDYEARSKLYLRWLQAWRLTKIGVGERSTDSSSERNSLG